VREFLPVSILFSGALNNKLSCVEHSTIPAAVNIKAGCLG